MQKHATTSVLLSYEGLNASYGPPEYQALTGLDLLSLSGVPSTYCEYHFDPRKFGLQRDSRHVFRYDTRR